MHLTRVAEMECHPRWCRFVVLRIVTSRLVWLFYCWPKNKKTKWLSKAHGLLSAGTLDFGG
jgi:hypothetical protein